MRCTDHRALRIVTILRVFIPSTPLLSLCDLRFWNGAYGIQNVMNDVVMNDVMNVVMSA